MNPTRVAAQLGMPGWGLRLKLDAMYGLAHRLGGAIQSSTASPCIPARSAIF